MRKTSNHIPQMNENIDKYSLFRVTTNNKSLNSLQFHTNLYALLPLLVLFPHVVLVVPTSRNVLVLHFYYFFIILEDTA